MPEVIVIDEIGTELEAAAARTIAERGVQLVGTAHGNTLDNLMLNPTLSDLIGGIQTVTLGDEEARRRGRRRRSSSARRRRRSTWWSRSSSATRVIVHRSVAETVDAILRGHMVPPESRCGRERARSGPRRSTTTGSTRPRRGLFVTPRDRRCSGFGRSGRGAPGHGTSAACVRSPPRRTGRGRCRASAGASPPDARARDRGGAPPRWTSAARSIGRAARSGHPRSRPRAATDEPSSRTGSAASASSRPFASSSCR